MARIAFGSPSEENNFALRSLHEAALTLQSEGVSVPAWADLLNGLVAPLPSNDDSADPGEWKHGWQFYMSNFREHHHRNLLLSQLNRADQARIRSCSGPNTSRWLTAIPKEDQLKLRDDHFVCSFARRLGMPITPLQDSCERCGRLLDPHGNHRACCMRTGRVQHRHKPLVNCWIRILREAGVVVPQRNIERTLASTHVNRGPQDLRRMDIVTPGIPGVFRGKPLFIDATCVSPLRGNGTPTARSARIDGAKLKKVDARTKYTDYPDVEQSAEAALLSLSVEVFGRWGDDCLQLVRDLSRCKALSSPSLLQKNVRHAWASRWWGLLSVQLQTIMATSLLRSTGHDLSEAAAVLDMPTLVDLL